ncbi:neuralized-like protein 4 [Lates japonicus]|uniref:Neuralized-like protein 4 n=1 Tax=Lates japonicus TaxID=270547 RepID=A0AAD3NFF4_LATJO|nr:neuralized-like protein 4 [Lates japonicus]
MNGMMNGDEVPELSCSHSRPDKFPNNLEPDTVLTEHQLFDVFNNAIVSFYRSEDEGGGEDGGGGGGAGGGGGGGIGGGGGGEGGGNTGTDLPPEMTEEQQRRRRVNGDRDRDNRRGGRRSYVCGDGRLRRPRTCLKSPSLVAGATDQRPTFPHQLRHHFAVITSGRTALRQNCRPASS